MLSFAVSMLAVPSANAQTETMTWPFVEPVPKKAGVGQPVLINFGLLNAMYDYNDGWNVTLQITYPNGKVEKHNAKTWSTGTVGRSFSFMEPGNYTLQCIYKNETYRGVKYASSESENVTLQILENYWKPSYPGHNLPAEYWTRPVDAQLREWYSIMGSWLIQKTRNLYAPYNDAPESAHILWTMPVGDTLGGLAGGDSNIISYQHGDAYEGKFAGSIIIAGKLYYNRYVSNSPQQTIVAVDLHTGKTLWERSHSFGGGRISHGQVLTFINHNNRGAWAYIWMVSGTNWFALDPATGDLKYNMTNVPSGTNYYGPNGEILKYSLQKYGSTWHLLQWNSTYVVNNGTRTGTGDAWGPNIQGRTYNAGQLGYDINMSIPQITRNLDGTTGNTATPVMAFPCDRVIFANASTAGITLSAISLAPEQIGQVLFNSRNWSAPDIWKDIYAISGSQIGWAAFSQEDLVAIYWTNMNRVNYAFSLETGKFLWESESHTYADAWGGASPTSSYGPEKVIAYGRLFESSVGGIAYCYNVTTGELLWKYEALDQYMESYHTENWWISPAFISSNKIYFNHFAHSAQEPRPRGAPFFALDVETGDIVWKIEGAFRGSGWGGRALIGDSVMVTMDTYDQQIYAVGKGPSAMTVSAPDVAVTAGTPFVIRGTVMDLSPGTQDANRQMRFSKGVPVVSDESMSEWMLYVYKNFERPMDTKGVDIDIWAFDPNGNEVHIGNTVSDASGTFSYTYTPEIDGDYEIFAYFMGSKSYYGSYAKTDMTVMTAPEVTEFKIPPYGWYIVGATIAIIAAIAVNIFVTLRKK